MILIAWSGTPSTPALDWAAREAVRTGDLLRILTVVALPRHLFDEAMGIPPEFIAPARRELARAEEHARAAGVEKVDTLLGYRDAAAAIVEASREADLVVVGNRGRGETASALLGSVAYAVTAHASCPVVVVRDDEAGADALTGPVVVGIDGSRPGVHAAYWAAEHAARLGRPVEVVASWDIGALGISSDFAALVGVSEVYADVSTRLHDWVDLAVTRMTERHPGLAVSGRVEEGPPVVVLRAAAEAASLLVVGTRGRGGFAGLLLGSVSHRLIHDAGCPIAVVR